MHPQRSGGLPFTTWGRPLHHRTRPWTHSDARGAASPRDRRTHTVSSTRCRLLPRPKQAKYPVSRMRSATRRCPESPGALPAPKATAIARYEPMPEDHRSAGVQRGGIERCEARARNADWRAQVRQGAHLSRPNTSTTSSRPMLIDKTDAGGGPRASGQAPSTSDSTRSESTRRQPPR